MRALGMLMALVAGILLVGCQATSAGPRTNFGGSPEPVLLTETTAPDGTITKDFTDTAALTLDIEQVASEFAIWDNHQKRAIVGSSKDESLDEATQIYEFDPATGNMIRAEITIKGKRADATAPTTATFEGATKFLEREVEAFKALMEAIADTAQAFGPGVSVDVESGE